MVRESPPFITNPSADAMMTRMMAMTVTTTPMPDSTSDAVPKDRDSVLDLLPATTTHRISIRGKLQRNVITKRKSINQSMWYFVGVALRTK